MSIDIVAVLPQYELQHVSMFFLLLKYPPLYVGQLLWPLLAVI